MSVLEEAVILPVSGGDETKLQEFISGLLESPDCPPYTMNIDQLNGYLHAVAAEPRATEAKEWMPLIFGGELPGVIDEYSQEAITRALISLYNSHRAQVKSRQCELGFVCEYSPDKTERLRSEQWARGFMQGYIFWEDIWSLMLDERQTGPDLAAILPTWVNDELDDILNTVTAVADADYAMQMGATSESLSLMFSRFPQKVIEYGQIAHMMRTRGYSEAKTNETG